MAKIIILGSSNAIADQNHDNTHLVIVGQERVVLVDAASSPIQRLDKAGVDYNDLTDIIITHFHPDHVAGIPLLLMDMWLLGRKRPLHIYGLKHALDRMENLMDAFGWERWPDFYPVTFNRIPSRKMTPVFSSPDFNIFSSPVQHLIPTIGLRIEFPAEKKVAAYSCDTSPSETVVELGKDADILIHEATGELLGHSSPAQAAEIAAKANARLLYLIHYPTGRFVNGDLVKEAQENFKGEVVQAIDFMRIEI